LFMGTLKFAPLRQGYTKRGLNLGGVLVKKQLRGSGINIALILLRF